ncbi:MULTISPECIES: LysR family transcriptional regulator [unclassified Rhizobium]|uniref:LysR family transcriptional regulator n=1 Tax=unclassified Rhizobium TaxID=2613769 RepID=UPI0006FCADB3|nr:MULTISPECIES: LysR family transcriptional regulator [unclassified Rhizobium]KQV41750.1 LysR family transcriptional regulator [Rhizobium sp. Root1212]KRD30042.1 LysR family transcriptional regulator [Rhizobium sp. Root268]
MRENFNDLLWFLVVAEESSFTKAAAKIGITQSTLSHTIKRLETRMGLRLLARTTRSVSTTEAGERLRQSLGPRIAEIETDIAALTAYRDKPSGTVRITVSDHALDYLVWPKLKPVLADYPDIKLEFSRDNGFRNIVEDGFDAGVRLGETVEKDMVAVRIGPDWRLVAVGAPGYFEARGIPQTPQDLMGHNCICLRLATAGGLYAWEFQQDGRDIRMRVDGQLTFNSTLPMVEAALAGYGIAYVPEDTVANHIAVGRLQVVLAAWSPPFAGYYLYYPSRRQNAPAFKAILDALRSSAA